MNVNQEARPVDTPGESDRSLRLLSDALVNYSGLAVGAVVGVLLVPVLLSHLGMEKYGLWLTAVALAALLRSVDFGLGLVVMREVAAGAGQPASLRPTQLVSAAGGAQLLLGLVAALVMVAAAVFLDAPLRLPAELHAMVLPVFALVAVAVTAEQAIGFNSAVLAGLRRFGILNLLGIALVLLRALGIVALLLLGHSLVAVAAWYAVATVIVAGVSFGVLRVMRGGYTVGLPGRHWQVLRGHMPFGVASFVSVTMAGVMWQALPLLTAALLGAGAVVPVHVGQRIPLVLTSLYGRLAAVVFPAASEYHRANDSLGTRALLETGSRLTMHLMLPVAVVGLLAAEQIFDVWVGDVSPEVILIFRLTLLAVLIDSTGSVAINVLWGRGEVARVLVAAVAGALTVVAGGILALLSLGTAAAVAVLALVLAVTSTAFWVLACHATGERPAGFALQVIRGVALPTLACAATAAVCLHLPGVPALARLVLAAAAGPIAYLWMLVKFGSSAAERNFLASAAQLPRKAGLAAGRAVGARIPALRTLGYLFLSVWAAVRHPTRRMIDEFDRTFAVQRDPWGYGESAQRDRIDVAMAAIDRVRAGTADGLIGRAIEIGCAEGTVTERLTSRCKRLVAADLSSVALARCRDRCAGQAGIEYLLTDIEGAAASGPYELVVAMDVLECIRSPRALRRARDAAVAMLVTGGHLVVTTTRQHPVPEGAWWGRWLPIGARINEFVARHPGLVVVSSTSTVTHAISVYRRSA